jgi:hypothetical protein
VLPAGALRDQLLTPAHTLLFNITRHSLVVQPCALDPNAFTAATPRRATDDRLLTRVLRRLYETRTSNSGRLEAPVCDSTWAAPSCHSALLTSNP